MDKALEIEGYSWKKASLSERDRSIGERFKPPKPVEPYLSALKTLEILPEKLSCRFRHIRAAFLRMDVDCDNFVSAKEFQHMLYLIGLELNREEYCKFWAFFDPTNRGKISFEVFADKLGGLIQPVVGTIFTRPLTPRLKKWQFDKMSYVARRQLESIEDCFHRLDVENKGVLTHAQFIELLHEFGLRKIGHEECYAIMKRYRDPSNISGNITFEEVKRVVVDFLRIPVRAAISEDVRVPKVDLIAAEKIIAAQLRGKFTEVHRAFRKFDADMNGHLDYEEFEAALRSMHIILSEEDMSILLKKYDTSGDGKISYEEFHRHIGPLLFPASKDLDSIITGSASAVAEEAKKSAALSGQSSKLRSQAIDVAKTLGVSTAEVLFSRSIAGKSKLVTKVLSTFDEKKLGMLGKKAFQLVLNSLNIPLTKEDIDVLFHKYPAEVIDRINYNNLLSNCTLFMDSSMIEASASLDDDEEEKESSIGSDSAAITIEGSSKKIDAGLEIGEDDLDAFDASIPMSPVARHASSSSPMTSASGKRGEGFKTGHSVSKSSDGMSVATSQVDVDGVEGRIRKVLGRSWMHVYRDIKSQSHSSSSIVGHPSISGSGIPASRSGSRSSTAPSASGSGVINSEKLKDALSTYGVSLTSKEARALSLKYPPSSPISGGSYVDMSLMMDSTFKRAGSMTLSSK